MSRNPQIIFKPIYKIISNFNLDGASNSINGYMDTLKLKRDYGLIHETAFWGNLLKCKLRVLYKNGRIKRDFK